MVGARVDVLVVCAVVGLGRVVVEVVEDFGGLGSASKGSDMEISCFEEIKSQEYIW